MSIADRAGRALSINEYVEPRRAEDTGIDWSPPKSAPNDQYILRMMVFSRESGWRFPKQLSWVMGFAAHSIRHHSASVGMRHPFAYITVRHGQVRSVTDDEWHVDGFSMRYHGLPEQNYIWCSDHPTEQLAQGFAMPEDFDPLRHDINRYFQDRAVESNAEPLQAGRVYAIDPYVIHRRPAVEAGATRTFLRLTMTQHEIHDPTCEPNPRMRHRFYEPNDTRALLTRYPS